MGESIEFIRKGRVVGHLTEEDGLVVTERLDPDTTPVPKAPPVPGTKSQRNKAKNPHKHTAEEEEEEE